MVRTALWLGAPTFEDAGVGYQVWDASIAMARRIWKAVVPGGDMEPKLAKAFGLCTLHVGCDC